MWAAPQRKLITSRRLTCTIYRKGWEDGGYTFLHFFVIELFTLILKEQLINYTIRWSPYFFSYCPFEGDACLEWQYNLVTQKTYVLSRVWYYWSVTVTNRPSVTVNTHRDYGSIHISIHPRSIHLQSLSHHDQEVLDWAVVHTASHVGEVTLSAITRYSGEGQGQKGEQ